jgi:hypothetical protein
MSKDINETIEGWDYNPDEVTVRKVAGEDGRDKIQMRLELGLLQMEISGRPDGKRPFGHESLFDYYLYLLEKQKSRYHNDEQFQLTPGDCQKLRQEALQYYHRYLSLFQLDEYQLVVRDTARNLRLFDFFKNYAAEESDRISLEQYRPYVIMMSTRARAAIRLEQKEYDEAQADVAEGIVGIRDFLRENGQLDRESECLELNFLLDLKRRIETTRPLSPRSRLEKELGRAVEEEDFERAAVLRDKLSDMGD